MNDEQNKWFLKRNYKIYAVDFDGTLTLNSHAEPELGEPNMPLFEFLIEKKKNGDKVILWTCRSDDSPIGNNRKLLTEAVEYCKSNGLEFDAVNDNLKEISDFYGINTRKITADYYIDDKAISILNRDGE